MKKNVRLSLILILILIVLVLGFIVGKLSQKKPPLPQKSPSLPEAISPQGDTLLVNTADYKIVFSPQSNQYDIIIYGSPFQEKRLLGEQEFLKLLNVSSAEGCNFNVEITTPYFANPKEAGIKFPLSFCREKTILPSPLPSPILFIDNRLALLLVKSVSPPSGEVEMGSTKNAISLSFAIPVDPKTAYLISYPNIQTVATVRKDDAKRLIIYPIEDWLPNTDYKLIIKAGLTSLDGRAQTKEDINLQYRVIEVKPPIYSRPP